MEHQRPEGKAKRGFPQKGDPFEGERPLSSYHAANGIKVGIITKADLSATGVLMPEDY